MRYPKSAFCFLCFISASVMAADEIPTTEQLKQLQNDKKWNDLLGGTTRALALKGDKATAYDLVELLSLKAEAQFQLKQFNPASVTYELISREKTATEEQIDTALASSLLSKKIDAKGYKVPAAKGEVAKVIDVYDPELRKDAFKAMFDSIYSDLKKDVDKNKGNPSLPAMAKSAKTLKDLQHVERAAYGKDQQSKDLIKEMDGMAVASIRKWLDTSDSNIQRIEQRASKEHTVIDNRTNRTTTQQQGLDANDRQELQQIISQCKGSVTSYKQFVEALPEPSEEIKGLPREIERIHDQATGVLNRVYR